METPKMKLHETKGEKKRQGAVMGSSEVELGILMCKTFICGRVSSGTVKRGLKCMSILILRFSAL